MVYLTAGLVSDQVYDAVAASDGKYDGIYFVGFDSGSKVHDWLMSDSKAKFICGVSQNPYLIGYKTVEELIKLSQGEKVEELVIVPGVIYNRDNYDELKEKFMVD